MATRLKVLMLGILVALLLAEGCLRCIGIFYAARVARRHSVETIDSGQKITILCLGNSFTLSPAGYDKSYPFYLEEMLRRHFPGKKISVINKGSLSSNSSEILSDLEKNIHQYSPQYLIVRTGTPNFWNRYKYSNYLRRTSQRSSFELFFLKAWERMSHEVRIFRFSNFILEWIQGKRLSKQDEFFEENSVYWDVVNWCERIWHQKFWTNYLDLESELQRVSLGKDSRIFSIDNEKADLAQNVLNEAVVRHPSNPKNYLLLGNLHFLKREFLTSAEFYMKGVKVDPEYRGIKGNENYINLRLLRKFIKDEKVQNRISSFIRECDREKIDAKNELDDITNDALLKWISSDLKEIIKIAGMRGIRLIIHNYPPRRGITRKFTMDVNDLLRKDAERSKILFIDHEDLFQKMWDGGIKEEDYHMMLVEGYQDIHLNEMGNRKMAENILNVLAPVLRSEYKTGERDGGK